MVQLQLQPITYRHCQVSLLNRNWQENPLIKESLELELLKWSENVSLTVGLYFTYKWMTHTTYVAIALECNCHSEAKINLAFTVSIVFSKLAVALRFRMVFLRGDKICIIYRHLIIWLWLKYFLKKSNNLDALDRKTTNNEIIAEF